MSCYSFMWTGSLAWMLFHVAFCVIGIRERPDWTSSMVRALILAALSPKFSQSLTNEHIWHLGNEHDKGWREAKSLVCISFPDLCRSSTGIALNPVRNVDILALVEKAPLWHRFQARTQGWESVKWIVGLLDSLIWCRKCSRTSRIPAASPSQGNQFDLWESNIALKNPPGSSFVSPFLISLRRL